MITFFDHIIMLAYVMQCINYFAMQMQTTHHVFVLYDSGMTRRCICNLSQCVSTNYMCKSEKRIYTNEDGSTTEVDAGCFVEELPKSQFGVTEANGRVTSARRGCVEHLNR